MIQLLIRKQMLVGVAQRPFSAPWLFGCQEPMRVKWNNIEITTMWLCLLCILKPPCHWGEKLGASGQRRGGAFRKVSDYRFTYSFKMLGTGGGGLSLDGGICRQWQRLWWLWGILEKRRNCACSAGTEVLGRHPHPDPAPWKLGISQVGNWVGVGLFWGPWRKMGSAEPRIFLINRDLTRGCHPRAHSLFGWAGVRDTLPWRPLLPAYLSFTCVHHPKIVLSPILKTAISPMLTFSSPSFHPSFLHY